MKSLDYAGVWPGAAGIKPVLAGFVAALALLAANAQAQFIFGTPTNLGILVNNSGSDGSPNISADGLSLYFDSRREGGAGDWDIWVSKAEAPHTGWGVPEPLAPPLNGPNADAGPSITADGLSLYFASNRPGGYGNFDIYVATRKTTQEPWGEPVNLGPTVNGAAYDNHPGISPDGLTLYFDSAREVLPGYYDLYVTKRATTADSWGAPEKLGPVVNTSFYELSPSISSDGMMLFFDRRSLFVDRDIWIAMRGSPDARWIKQLLLDAPVNSAHNDTDPSISGDGTMLYFGSDRPEGLGGQDLWQVSIEPVRAIPDFNLDGVVDSADLSVLAHHWLALDQPSLDIAPAPEGDGVVDYLDLAGLFKYWLSYPGLLARWMLDETEGNIAHDVAGGDDGDLYGGPLWQSDAGRIDGALLLDGTDDYVHTGFVLDPAAGAFTVLAWVKGGRPGQVIVSQANGAGTGRSWLCTDASSGRLATELKAPGGRINLFVSQAVVTDGLWHQVRFAWDGACRFLYVDGERVFKDAEPLTELESSNGGLYFGVSKKREAGTFFSGLIDDIRIYNKALTP